MNYNKKRPSKLNSEAQHELKDKLLSLDLIEGEIKVFKTGLRGRLSSFVHSANRAKIPALNELLLDYAPYDSQSFEVMRARLIELNDFDRPTISAWLKHERFMVEETLSRLKRECVERKTMSFLDPGHL